MMMLMMIGVWKQLIPYKNKNKKMTNPSG